MEQIQIRQPKMPAAQSFIQIWWTFLAILIIFIALYSSFARNNLLNLKTAKTIGVTSFNLKKSNFIYQKVKCRSVMKLRISRIYYVLLIFRYISFSSHEKTQFVFWNQEISGFLIIKLSLKIVLCTEQIDEEIVINLEINNLKI